MAEFSCTDETFENIFDAQNAKYNEKTFFTDLLHCHLAFCREIRIIRITGSLIAGYPAYTVTIQGGQ